MLIFDNTANFQLMLNNFPKNIIPKVSLHTIGCRLNQAETAIIAGGLKKRGFEIVEFGQPADLTVINTCTVTGQADAKCRQAVRQSIRANPEAFIAVIGCYSQMAADEISKIKGIDLIIGTEHKFQIADYLNDLHKRTESLVIHTAKISKEEFVIETSGLCSANTRANLKIQDGCSFVCSFCIIAKARGPARSRKFGDILAEAEKLAQAGYKEIVLTGVNIGTYNSGGKQFTDVLAALENTAGLERIRISSIEPTTVDKNLIDCIAASNKICRHLHIPLQSGDDDILESMRRKHTADEFKEIMEYAADTIPNIGLGTDVMVGYPGESEEQFTNTKNFLNDLPVSYFHVFTYSDRKGTSAYKLQPKVDHHVKKYRNRILIELGNRKKYNFYKSFLRKELDVLFEEKVNDKWSGLSGNYMRIKAKSALDLRNKICTVRLNEIDKDTLIGELV